MSNSAANRSFSQEDKERIPAITVQEENIDLPLQKKFNIQQAFCYTVSFFSDHFEL